MTMNERWPGRKKIWYNQQLKENKPERFKKEMKAFYEKRLKDLNA